LIEFKVKVKQHVVDLKLQPLNMVLRKAMEQINTKDPGDIFSVPVDSNEVCDEGRWDGGRKVTLGAWGCLSSLHLIVYWQTKLRTVLQCTLSIGNRMGPSKIKDSFQACFQS
jgi:hypothetical protein